MSNAAEKLDDEFGDDIEIDIVDATPEPDRGRPVAGDDDPGDFEVDDAEMAEFSADAKSRINRLVAKAHDQRRAKEQAARERNEAIEFARRENARANELQEQLKRATTGVVNATKSQLETEIAAIEESIRDASDLADAKTVAAKTKELVEKTFQLNQAKYAEQQLKSQPAQSAQPAQPSIPQPSAKLRSWMDKNRWFTDKSHRRETAYAYAIHEEAIESGLEPDSDAYYNHIDREMRKIFPSLFDQAFKKPDSPPTANRRSASTSPSSGGRTRVKLTSDQLAICRALNVKPEDYARELLKKERE